MIFGLEPIILTFFFLNFYCEHVISSFLLADYIRFDKMAIFYEKP
jgi:hypothetical protein